MTPQPTTADALLQIGISPNVPDANMEPANLVDAIAQIGNALRYSAKWLGNGDAGTPMGALEAHGVAITEGADRIASALDGIAEAIGRHAEAQANPPLRDYFAGQALIALLTTGGTPEGSSDLTSGEDASLVQDARCSGWGAPIPHTQDENGQPISYAEEFADEAYTLADAMIRRRAKT